MNKGTSQYQTHKADQDNDDDDKLEFLHHFQHSITRDHGKLVCGRGVWVCEYEKGILKHFKKKRP